MNKQEKDKITQKYKESKTPYDEELKLCIKRLSYLRSELQTEEGRYMFLKEAIIEYRK